MQTIDCPLCDVDDASPYREENGHHAVQCRSCGLVYCNPRPSIEQMKALYEGQETKIDLYGHLAQRDYKSIQARRCLRVIQRYRQRGRLLEIGSAAGYFLAEARALGFTVQGLDLTRQFVEFSTEVLGVPAFEGTLMAAPFEAGSFDVLYHRNVMSHLAYPVQELRRMHELLAPGGLLVFETGNVAELPPQEAGELELPDHLFHFSESTLRVLLERTGFEHLRTHRYLLVKQLPAYRALLDRRPPRRRAAGPSRPLPDRLPPSTLGQRLAARAATALRYDVGGWLPAAGRRCTLIVVAEKPRSP